MTLRLSVALVGIVCVLGSACGGGGSDQTKVEWTVQQFAQDFILGSGADACSFVTGAMKRQLTGGHRNCPTAVNESAPDGDQIAKVQDQLNKKATVTVNGDHATVRYPGTALSEIDISGSTVKLVKVGGRWYISGVQWDRPKTPRSGRAGVEPGGDVSGQGP